MKDFTPKIQLVNKKEVPSKDGHRVVSYIFPTCNQNYYELAILDNVPILILNLHIFPTCNQTFELAFRRASRGALHLPYM